MARQAEWRRRLGGGAGVPSTFDGQVGASSDDAFQDTGDSVTINGEWAVVDDTNEHVGMRWTSVTIPAGATIDVAHVGVFIAAGSTDEPQHRIKGELTANPGTFTTTSDDIDSRGRTSVSVDWDSADLGSGSNEEWEWGASTAGEGNGSNLNAIVQEIIDLGGWASGNALIMIFEQHTLHAGRDLGIRLWDYSDNTFGPKLHVEFTA